MPEHDGMTVRERLSPIESFRLAAEKLHEVGEKQRLFDTAYQLADGHELVASQFFLGKAEEARQRGDAAGVERYLAAAELFVLRMLPDDSRVASGYYTSGLCELGKSYGTVGNRERASELLQEALKSTRHILLPGVRAEALLGIAAARRDLGDRITARVALDHVMEIMADPKLGAISREAVVEKMIASGHVGYAMRELATVDDDYALGRFARTLIVAGHPAEAFDLAKRISNPRARVEYGKLLAAIPTVDIDDVIELISKEGDSFETDPGAALEADHDDIGEIAVNFVLAGKTPSAEWLLQKGGVVESHIVGRVIDALLEKGELRTAQRLADKLSKSGRIRAIASCVQHGHLQNAFSLLEEDPFYQTEGLTTMASGIAHEDGSDQPDAAFAARQDIISRASRMEQIFYRVSALRAVGRIFAHQETTREFADQAIRELDRVDQELSGREIGLRPDIALARAEISAALGRQEDARRSLDVAVTNAQNIRDPGIRSEILAEAAAFYSGIGDTDRARELALQVAALLPRELNQSKVVKVTKDIARAGAAGTAVDLSSRIESTFEKIDVCETMIVHGAVPEALGFIDAMGDLDTAFQSRIVSAMVVSGHPQEALAFAKDRCTNDFSRLELVRTLLATKQYEQVSSAIEELQFTFPENRLQVVKNAAAAAAPPIVVRDLVLRLHVQELDLTDLDTTIVTLVKLDYPESAMVLAHHLTDQGDIVRAGFAFAEKGNVEEALRLSDKIVDPEHRLHLFTTLARQKMQRDLSAYVTRDEQFRLKYRDDAIDPDATIKYYGQSKQTPDESIVGDVLYATRDDHVVERFLSLFPESKRMSLRRRYQRYSGMELACAYDGVLPESLLAFLRETDIDVHRFASEWLHAGPKITSIQICNIAEMAGLERKRPGIVATLYRDYRLSNIGRYPDEMLLDLFDHRNVRRPYVLMVLTKYDHNGAFYLDWKSFEELYQRLRGRYALVVAEAGNRIGVTRRIVDAYRRYGKSGGRIWGAHGRKDGMRFGPDVIDNKGKKIPQEIRTEDLDSDAANILNAHAYEPGSPELFLSCSTGAAGGFAEQSFKRSGAMRTAPKEDAGRAMITPRFDETGKLVAFDADYIGSETAKFGVAP